MYEALTATREMAAFAHRLGAHGSVRERTRRLYLAVLDEGLQVAYNEEVSADWRPHGCKDARATFEEKGPDGKRFGMCIEYTALFLALGRLMNLELTAMRDSRCTGESDGFLFGHVVAGVRDGDAWHVVDLANRRFWRDPNGFEPVHDGMLQAYVYNNSGLIFKAQGRLPEAEHAISAALALEASHGAFWYNRGCVRLVGGNPHAAHADLDRAAALVPRSAHVLTNLAVAQCVLGERNRARATLYLARELAPGDARIAYNQGVLAYEEAAYDEALVHWRDALAADPAHAPARRSLGHLLRAVGRGDEGLRVLAGLV